MKQSRLMSLVESIANVAVGYGVAVVTQILIFPIFGLHTTLAQNLQMGLVFTGASIVRSFTLRRLFEALRVSATKPPLRTSGGSVPVRLPYRRNFGGAPGRDQASSR
ncbi:hypothetical protein JSE7799_00419 [Jannaschia seosinensis]|uniref:Uncharacterized protein n=1 Tax=Jannaschia seosinensis TaxID=313367 RepID=A0A0M7B7D5_9RHOB|nr:hypothetical protein JSE7799_00419 [Jannaschia seosinensis]